MVGGQPQPRWIEEKMKRFFKFMLAIDAVLLIISAIIAAFYQARFGTILIWTGFAAIILGGMAAMGAGSVAGEYNFKLDQTMPQLNYERTPEKWQEMNKSYSFCLLMGAAGGISIVSGLAINYFFTGAF